MFEDVPDKDFLKANLPLQFVCSQLGIVLGQDGKGICPMHDDRTPSWRLYEGDDGFMRWHCFPCDRGGDIFSAIMYVEGVSFPDSLKRAQEMYELLQKPGAVVPEVEISVPEPRDWTAELDAVRQNQQGFAASLFNAPDSPQSRLFDDWAVKWGWGIGDRGEIYMPHWNADGTLTGCKVRARNGDRWSMQPSKYEALYGAWRGRNNRDVLICEGETDALWASFQAYLLQIPIDVFALPSGVQRPLTPEHMHFLSRRKGKVYLVLDPDNAGVLGTRQMIDDLVAGEWSQDEIRVCSLPLGRDLRSARPQLRELLDSAQTPMQPRDDLTVGDSGSWWLKDKEGNRHRLTEWHFEPVTRLVGEDLSGYRGDLVYRGQRYDKILTLPDLASQSAFTRWATKNGVQYTKTDVGRRAIAEWIESRASIVPHEFLATRVGIQPPPESYGWSGKSLVYPDGYEGQLPWRYHPSELTADVHGQVLLRSGELSERVDWDWLAHFVELAPPEVTHPLLAWLVAAARRDEVQDFPIMFISGSSGVGKSTLAYLAQRLMGSEIRTDLGGNTPFVINRVLASSTSLPVFVDEWTRQSKKDTLERFQEVVTTIYSGGNAQRGRADLTVVDYKMSSPIIVAGENTFSLDRERDRMVTIMPSRAGQNKAALFQIRDKPLHLVGARIHHYVATHRGLPEMDQGNIDRPTHNRLVLEAGWATLLQMLEGYHDAPALPERPDLSALDPEVLAATNENAYETALQEGLTLTDKNHHPLVWPDTDGTWVRCQVLVTVIEKETDIQLAGGSRAMSNYLAERYGNPVERRVPMPGGVGTARARFFKGLHIEGAEDALSQTVREGT